MYLHYGKVQRPHEEIEGEGDTRKNVSFFVAESHEENTHDNANCNLLHVKWSIQLGNLSLHPRPLKDDGDLFAEWHGKARILHVEIPGVEIVRDAHVHLDAAELPAYGLLHEPVGWVVLAGARHVRQALKVVDGRVSCLAEVHTAARV